MKLDLDDFSYLAVDKPSTKIDAVPNEEEIQTVYQKKIEELERHYQELLKKVSQEYYDRGFADAQQKYEQELTQQKQQLIDECNQRIEAALAQARETYNTFEKQLNQQYAAYIQNLQKIILDAIGDVLEFLYIDPSNTSYVKEAIEQIFEEFHNYLPLHIYTSQKSAHYFQEHWKKIPIDSKEGLQDNEFIIEFHDFEIENKIRQKLELIKNEIAREIKKLT